VGRGGRPGRWGLEIDVEELLAGVEHFGAAAATHPAFRDPELVFHDAENGSASGATGGKTHGEIMP
jgi:hypothetical protein